MRWYPTHRELEPRAGGEVRESDLPGDGELPGDGDLSGDGDLPGAGVPLGHQTVPGPLADHRPTALAAWHIQLELLALHLEGDGPCWPEERTEELRAYYARRLT